MPRPTPGPKRLRAAGLNIQFPKEKEFPPFLLEQGTIDFSIGGTSPVRGAYAGAVRGLTSTPSLYGQPMVLSASRQAAGSALAGIDVHAIMDHVTSRTKDSASARLRGIKLPSFEIPGVPFRVDPGTGTSNLDFSMKGGGTQLSGRWSIASQRVRWAADTTGRPLNEIERLVWRVVSGLSNLEVVAELTGSMTSPTLSVRSNLDQAIADRLKAVIGEEVARAERLVRTKVDSLVADKVEPVKRQIAAVQTQANQRVQTERQRLDQVEQQLQTELKRLTGGLVPGLELPKIKL